MSRPSRKSNYTRYFDSINHCGNLCERILFHRGPEWQSEKFGIALYRIARSDYIVISVGGCMEVKRISLGMGKYFYVVSTHCMLHFINDFLAPTIQ